MKYLMVSSSSSEQVPIASQTYRRLPLSLRKASPWLYLMCKMLGNTRCHYDCLLSLLHCDWSARQTSIISKERLLLDHRLYQLSFHYAREGMVQFTTTRSWDKDCSRSIKPQTTKPAKSQLLNIPQPFCRALLTNKVLAGSQSRFKGYHGSCSLINC